MNYSSVTIKYVSQNCTLANRKYRHCHSMSRQQNATFTCKYPPKSQGILYGLEFDILKGYIP